MWLGFNILTVCIDFRQNQVKNFENRPKRQETNAPVDFYVNAAVTFFKILQNRLAIFQY